MQQRVTCALHFAKLHGAGEPVAVVCELGGAHTLPPGHGGVHNASHHVDWVLNLYAGPICKGEPPVPFGGSLDGVRFERYVWLRNAMEDILVACKPEQKQSWQVSRLLAESCTVCNGMQY